MNVNSRKALRALIEGGGAIGYERDSGRLMLSGDMRTVKRLHPRIVKHREALIPVVVAAEELTEQLLGRIMSDVKAGDTAASRRLRASKAKAR